MKLRTLILVCCLTITTSVFSQENKVKDQSKKAPLSIYTDGIAIVTSRYDTQFISDFLADNQFQFLIIRQESIAKNMFMIDFRNIGRKASIYDYESYRRASLNKYFDIVPDIVVFNRFSNPQFDIKF